MVCLILMKDAERNNIKAMLKFGKILLLDDSTQDEGLPYLKKAADRNNADAMIEYRNWLLKLKKNPGDEEEAEKYFKMTGKGKY